MTDFNIQEILPLAPVKIIYKRDNGENRVAMAYIDYLSNTVIPISGDIDIEEAPAFEKAILEAHKKMRNYVSAVSVPENINEFTVDKLVSMKEKYVRNQ